MQQFDAHLNHLRIYHERGQCYLDATYIQKNGNNISEINVPKIKLPFAIGDLNTIVVNDYGRLWDLEGRSYIEAGHCIFPIEKVCETKHMDKDECPIGGVYYTLKVIKEEAREMTIEEIEKELGYKIKIISKKED